MTRFIHNIIAASAALLLMGAGASCTMMQDKTDDCPTGLYVRFVYDYNTQRADMFRDHVGHVKLYVYDETGRKVAEKSVSNGDAYAPLRDYGYSVHFDPSELAPGRYRLQAVGMQKDWDDALATDGAKYRLEEGDSHTDLKIHLDHAAEALAGTNYHPVEHRSAALDTLWHTLKVMSYEPRDGRAIPSLHATKAPYSVYPLEEQYVTVASGYATYATVSLVRDTKHLNITLRQIDEPDKITHNDFDVDIIEPNGTIGHDNCVAAGDSLLYTPYASWTSRFDDGGVTVEPQGSRADETAVQRTAHYNLMFNRLVIDSNDPAKGALLRIRKRADGKTVALINLTQFLSEGRIAYDIRNYGAQDYLDREYDYHLNLFLQGNKWKYCDIVVNVLGWARRKENIEL